MTSVHAENRTALIIANGEYVNFSPLENPVREAQALSKTLEDLGFSVSLVKNGSKEQMLDAIEDFSNTIRTRKGVALFHYGGHGIQVEDENYLIPVDADIPDARRVTTRAVNLDEVVLAMDAAGADTNLLFLDACRNNPLPSSTRAATRGMVIQRVRPKNSLIVYAAEAGTVAQDGLFTPALTRNLGTQGMSLTEILTKVRSEVFSASKGVQTPGEYSQLFAPVYLNGKPMAVQPAWGDSTLQKGGLIIQTAGAATVKIGGTSRNLPADSKTEVKDLATGSITVTATYSDGKVENQTMEVLPGKQATLTFTYRPGPQSQTVTQSKIIQIPSPTFQWNNAVVQLSPYLISFKTVTQREYLQVLGTNPSQNKNGLKHLDLPIEQVTWWDAIKYCNALSQRDGLRPVYSLDGDKVSVDYSAKGWRLPTEAEFQYAAGTGKISLSEGFYEWCGDWFGNLPTGRILDPIGIPAGTKRILRSGADPESPTPMDTPLRSSFFPNLKDPTWTFRVVRRP